MDKLQPDQMPVFEEQKRNRIATYQDDCEWQQLSNAWLSKAIQQKYMYNFTFLDRPIIQTPMDMIAMQELIWQVRPDLIIETGIAHGGSLIMSASMLALLDYCEAVERGTLLDPGASHRRVLGIDIDIRQHNQAAIEAHPMARHITLIQGSSIDPDVISQVHAYASHYQRILVCLDSNHTHAHVLAELEAYAPLVSPGSYCVAFDTIIEDLPDTMYPDRPWSKGNNSKTAVWEYLQRLSSEGRMAADGKPLRFEIDTILEHKLLITTSPDGYLKRIV